MQYQSKKSYFSLVTYSTYCRIQPPCVMDNVLELRGSRLVKGSDRSEIFSTGDRFGCLIPGRTAAQCGFQFFNFFLMLFEILFDALWTIWTFMKSLQEYATLTAIFTRLALRLLRSLQAWHFQAILASAHFPASLIR